MSNGKVTIKDVYDIVGRVEEKLDKLEGRISILEIWRAEVVAKMSIAVAGVTLAFTLAWDVIKNKLGMK